MVKNRTCLTCDNTGLTEKGFCHECKGKGFVEVIQHAEDLSHAGKPDIVLLLLSISKHTSEKQYSQIIRDYLQNTI